MTKQRCGWNLAIVVIVASMIFVGAVLIVRRWQQNTQVRQEPAAITSIAW